MTLLDFSEKNCLLNTFYILSCVRDIISSKINVYPCNPQFHFENGLNGVQITQMC